MPNGISKISFLLIQVLLLLSPRAAISQVTTPASDWLTWGYDQQRTGWNRGETTLSKDNVSKLTLKWSTRLSTPPTNVALSTLTAPLVMEKVKTIHGLKNLVFLLGADDTVFALDADSGKLIWKKSFTNHLSPLHPGTWLCSNTANDTPVIDRQRGILYLISSDGKLRGLGVSDGADRMTPVDFVAPFSRSWSLNLIDNVIYTSSSRSCGQVPGELPPPLWGAGTVGGKSTTTAARAEKFRKIPVEASSISAMDVSDPANPRFTRFYTSGGREAGSWGLGGVVQGPNDSIFLQTSDGMADPASGEYGDSVLELAPRASRLLDSFTPANWRYLNTHDLDLGSATPAVFPFQHHTLVASAGKEGFIYLLDTSDLGGGGRDHAMPLYKTSQLGNDEAILQGRGIWGALATYENPLGERFLYVPLWGPASKNAPQFKSSYGPTPHGSIMAFRVSGDGGNLFLIPVWTSPDMIAPEPPVVANGVVYAIQTGEQTMQIPVLPPGMPRPDPSTVGAEFRATPVSHLILFAFDAETGKPLYSSKEIIQNWTHFTEPVVALNKVFLVTHDAHVYAFGLK